MIIDKEKYKKEFKRRLAFDFARTIIIFLKKSINYLFPERSRRHVGRVEGLTNEKLEMVRVYH